ncbi:aldehyde dehydrogenase family protein [Paraburkholderia flagellata]|uniref:aldehyde dehydrogenase family protein n=1 Tax=Paraburkholderia flagellata TaxID=2883241 RepID=UPI001F373C3E|nr:aldehyde dehydrogenase family protein [Paraburkholderia flagellata]
MVDLLPPGSAMKRHPAETIIRTSGRQLRNRIPPLAYRTSPPHLLAMDAFTHLPPGLVQVLSGGADVGRQLVEHEHTHGIAFTGSIAAGHAVAHGAAERFKPVLIEASGNDPLIVMPSAPIAAAARNVAYATFLNAGQVCTSPERLYVHEAIYDAFLPALVKEAQALRVGDGLDDVDMGPMVSQRELQRVERIIGRALEQGARIMTGGRRPPLLDKGWFYEPTMLAVEHHMDIMHDECFGPVAPVCKVSSLNEALQLANDSRFALGASIYTHDLTEAMQAVNEIESGMVWVNTPLNDNDGVPFGGRKMSGVGRQLGVEGLEQFRRSKMVILAPEVVGSDELFPYKPEYGHRAVVKD